MARENRYKAKERKEQGPPARKVSFNWNRLFSGTGAPVAWGVFFMLLGMVMEIAFLSYFFTGSSDQSALDTAGHEGIREAGRLTENFFGYFGALTAHVFIFRWFGVGALLLPVIPFMAGWKLFFKSELLPLGRNTKRLLFYTLWLSLVFGYLVLMGNAEESLGYLSGGFGYTVNVYLFSLLKWGSILPIVFTFFLFLIFFHNVTDFRFRRRRSTEDAGEYETDEPGAGEAEGEAGDPPLQPASEATYDDEEEELVVAEESHPRPVRTHTPPEAFTLVVESEPEIPREEERMVGIQLEIDPDESPSLLTASHMAAAEGDGDLSDQLVREFGKYDPTLDLPAYRYPTLGLLKEAWSDPTEKVSSEELESNKNRIVETLASYGINIDKIKAAIGPTVTLYEIIPAAGVRISKIQNLEKDIALSLAALGIRIIAPMPGRGTIGIEVPNKQKETVLMRSVLESERFQKANYELPVVLGKTISNEI